MPDYTLVNLREVEDSAPKFGYAPDMEARFAAKPLELKESGASFQRLAPNFRQPFGHTHREQEEVYVVVEGSGRVKIDDEIVDLSQWDAVRVPAGTMRCFEGGAEGITYVAFGAPTTIPMMEDQPPVPGWWTD